MKTMRLFFKKVGRAKFCSHLDLNRYMLRAMRMSGIPFWYTEGFNPHPYITFVLPLSLGFESEYEAMDFRLEDDNFSAEACLAAFQKVLPPELVAFRVAEPVKKPGKIAAASFRIYFEGADAAFVSALKTFLQQPSILVEKVGKKKKVSTVELAGRFRDAAVSLCDGGAQLEFTLPAGGGDNINPTLYLQAAKEAGLTIPAHAITRTMLYDDTGAMFQ